MTPWCLQHDFRLSPIHTCYMTHSCLWLDFLICVTWLIHTCDMTHSCLWHDLLIRVTWLMHTCDITHSCLWLEFLTCVTWLIHTCDLIHSRLWHDLFKHVTWLIHMRDMNRLNVHDSAVWMYAESCTSDVIHICVTHMLRYDKSCYTYVSPICWDMTSHVTHMWHPYVEIWQVMLHICVHQMWHICHTCVWHDFLMSATWLVHMTHAYVWYAPFMFVTWLL